MSGWEIEIMCKCANEKMCKCPCSCVIGGEGIVLCGTPGLAVGFFLAAMAPDGR